MSIWLWILLILLVPPAGFGLYVAVALYKILRDGIWR